MTQPVRTEWATKDPLLTEYYDTEWGMPVVTETGIFERLVLESFQSGLSWLTILKRRPAFRELFHHFDVDAVAGFTEAEVEALMRDDRIIRNRRKITAAVTNARCTVALRDTVDGGLPALVWSYMPETSPAVENADELPSHSPESQALATQLKQRGFTMVGPTMIYALMSAIGIVDLHTVGSYRRGCSGLWNIDGTRSGEAPRLGTPSEQRA